MPRTPRNIAADVCYHVLNRGNGRQHIFHTAQDYQAFLRILTEALARYEVELHCWCLMPNHWHLVLRPGRDDALQNFMRWLTVTHVRRHYEHYHDKSGHLYQGRYKAFPVEEDEYFLGLCRYIEANPRRAKLVERAEQWRWSSLHQRLAGTNVPPLTEWPVDRPTEWVEIVNESQPDKDREPLRASFMRERPFGSEKWITRMATRLGLQQTLRSPGRPKKPLSQLSTRQRHRREKQGDTAGKSDK